MMEAMDTNEAAERVMTAALRLKSALAADGVMAAARHLKAVFGKANFNPNQPRVPAGNEDGGQWTDGGGSDTPESLDPQIWFSKPSNELPVILASGAEEPPDIPKLPPPTTKLRNAVVKDVAKWVARAALRGAEVGLRISPLGRILNLIEAGVWLYEHIPRIEAYIDEPKSLQELQNAVGDNSREGYEDHHINEQTPARKAGYAESTINARENLVRIPTLKHWQSQAGMRRRTKDLADCLRVSI